MIGVEEFGVNYIGNFGYAEIGDLSRILSKYIEGLKVKIMDSCNRLGYFCISNAHEVSNRAIENEGLAHEHARISLDL